MSYLTSLLRSASNAIWAMWIYITAPAAPAKPGPARLFGNTRSLIKAVWIFTIVMVPVLVGVVIVMFLKPEAVTFSGRLMALDRDVAELSAQVGSIQALVSALVFLPLVRELLRIMDSAITGDPFVPENARRLRKIGWLLLAFNFLSHQTWLAFGHRGLFFPGPSVDINLTGLMTVLLVFVLAHVFEQGSRMRAELQETI